MRYIQLTQGYKTMVDDEDYDRLNKYYWCAVRQGKNSEHIYASRRIGSINMTLHRILMNPPRDLMVDHIDRNGLNNQRSNLRIVTRGQNRMNSRGIAASGYKGVFKTNNGKFGVRFGAFDTSEEAARAYDRVMKEYYKEFAVLNFPEN